MTQHPAIRVTQMFPNEHHAHVACLIIRDGSGGMAVETLTATQVDALIDQLQACKATAKRERTKREAK